MYRPLKDVNENYRTFIDECVELVNLDKFNSEVIIAGDYNIDLLKINDKPIISEYFDTITSHDFSQNDFTNQTLELLWHTHR